MKYELEEIGPAESKWQRRLWCVNILTIVLTFLTYSDNVDVSVRILVVACVPLILQVYHTYNQGASQ